MSNEEQSREQYWREYWDSNPYSEKIFRKFKPAIIIDWS